MSDINQFAPVMEELGISPDSLDASDLELDSIEVASEEEVTEEVSSEEEETEEDEESQTVDESSPEGEEKETATEEATATEEVSEEKTAKESQEIEAQRLDLEAKIKAFEEQKQNFETELVTKHAEKLKAHDEFDSFLSSLAERDPELFSLLQEEFAVHAKANHNPALENLKREQEKTAKQLEEIKRHFSDETTRTKYYAELDKVKSTIGKEAESLGVKVDWKQVEEVWKDNQKLSIEEAFHAKYGATYAKAAASKAKVQAVENKVKARPTVSTAGTVQRPNSKSSPAVPTDAFDAVKYFAKQLTGKN